LIIVRKTMDAGESLARAIRDAYRAGQEDEALEPIVRADSAGRPVGRIAAGDAVIFYDVRGEREVELSRSLVDREFSAFPVLALNLRFVTLIEYSSTLPVAVAFPLETRLRNTLAEVLTGAGFRVPKISESEKAIHVSYFFNGKREEPFPGEEQVTVPSPETADYAAVPGLNAAGVVSEVQRRLAAAGPQVIVANLANVDVVGHLDDRAAVLEAVVAVDGALAEIVAAARREKATLLVTSDHGTVEEWLYPDGAANTGHTKNPVPFILADFGASDPAGWTIRKTGELADVAPTILELAAIPRPEDMTGRSLLLSGPEPGRPRRKILLLILDGWGLRDETYGNMIREARTPAFDELWAACPHAVLDSFGEAVGMPPGAVGNSEAGHLHLGAGRRVLLDRVRIDAAIENGSFFRNEALLEAMRGAREVGKALHLMGIISHYSSHGTIRHLFALLRMAKEQGVERVFIHGFIGRRGELPESGAVYVEKVEEMSHDIGVGRLVTVMGRFWSLDREENWDRVEKAYRALVEGVGTAVPSP
jgi:2,3-bisphosphoglycerate-independent phosphoglycerate mutase